MIEIVKVIPQEIENIAVSLPEEERLNLFSILEKTFSETSKWRTQVDAIEVSSIDQKTEMKQLDLLRKGVKDARLKAVAFAKQKRDELQIQMAVYSTQDKVWLKVIQLIEENLKAVEKDAEYKAKFAERYEAQQKELRTSERLNKCLIFDQSIQKSDVENLTDVIFDAYLSSIEKKYNDRIEAERIEAEKQAEEKRKQEVFNLRRELIISNDLLKWHKVGSIDLETTEADFEAYFSKLKGEKEAYEAEQKRICEENERLIKEAKEKEEAEKAEKLRVAGIKKYFEMKASALLKANGFKENRWNGYDLGSISVSIHEISNIETQDQYDSFCKSISDRLRDKAVQDEKDRIAAEELRIANEKAAHAAKEAERLRKESEAKEAARKKEEDDRIAAEKKAASAPDLKKFQELKKAIEAIQIPEAKGLTAQKFAADCKEMQKRFANKVQEYINQL